MTRRTRSAVMVVRVILALDEDEFAIATVFFVQCENGVRRRAGTGKGIKNDSIFVSRRCCNMRLNQADGFWRFEM